MKTRDLIVETASALDSNRGRSILTILGIVIGISAVIAMTALIGGIKQSLMGELGLEQARMVSISAWGGRGLTIDDIPRLEQGLPDYEFITSTIYTGGEVKSATAKDDGGSVVGVEDKFFRANTAKLVSGRLISSADNDSSAMVVVIDQIAARKLFDDDGTGVVGQKLALNNTSFSIIGVLESAQVMRGASGSYYVPLKTAATRLYGGRQIFDLIGLANENTDLDAIVDRTKNYIASYLQVPADEVDDSIHVQTVKSLIDQVNATMMSFQVLMTSVAAISLLVGGIGIMNMMLTNVTERIREIGLRKALGARASDITRQFLLESVVLCLAGGVIGIIFGYLGSFALTGLAGNVFEVGSESGSITPVIDVQAVAIATGICVLIGIVFGFYPARRAAKLDPVESLHYQ